MAKKQDKHTTASTASYDITVFSPDTLESMYMITIEEDGSVEDGYDWFPTLAEWAEYVDAENAAQVPAFAKRQRKAKIID